MNTFLQRVQASTLCILETPNQAILIQVHVKVMINECGEQKWCLKWPARSSWALRSPSRRKKQGKQFVVIWTGDSKLMMFTAVVTWMIHMNENMMLVFACIWWVTWMSIMTLMYIVAACKEKMMYSFQSIQLVYWIHKLLDLLCFLINYTYLVRNWAVFTHAMITWCIQKYRMTRYTFENFFVCVYVHVHPCTAFASLQNLV